MSNHYRLDWQEHPSIQNLKKLNLSAKTLSIYLSQVKLFLKSIFPNGFISADLDWFLNQPISEIEKALVQNICSLKYYSTTTKNQRSIALRTWVELATGHSLLHKAKFYRGLNSKRLDNIHPEELETTLKTIDLTRPQGKRDCALILLIWTTNIDSDEIGQLKLQDLNFQDKQIKLQNQWKNLTHSTLAALKIWLNTRQELTPDDFVFISNRSVLTRKPLNYFWVTTTLKRYGLKHYELINGSINHMLQMVNNDVSQAIEISPNGRRKINNQNIQLLEKQLLA